MPLDLYKLHTKDVGKNDISKNSTAVLYLLEKRKCLFRVCHFTFNSSPILSSRQNFLVGGETIADQVTCCLNDFDIVDNLIFFNILRNHDNEQQRGRRKAIVGRKCVDLHSVR